MATSTRDTLIDPLFNDNQIALQVLGICSALAVTTQLKPSVVMSVVMAILAAWNEENSKPPRFRPPFGLTPYRRGG